MAKPKPAYIERGGEQVFGQPVSLEQVRFSSYFVRVDNCALEAVCDRYLTGPTGGKWRFHPVFPMVMLGVADIGKITSLDPNDSYKGYIKEIDVAFWMLVARLKKTGPIWFVERLEWFLPYVFVNNAWAMACGREVYGFPKAMAEIVAPNPPTTSTVVSVDTLVLPKFDPTTEATQKRLLEVNRLDVGTPGELETTWTDAKTAFEEFFKFIEPSGKIQLPGVGVLVEIFKLLVHFEMPLVFLKEFRDVAIGSQTCYRAIVEAPATVKSFRRAGLLKGKYELVVQDYASHPIIRELGLSGPRSPVFSSWFMDFDFVMGNGTELWKG